MHRVFFDANVIIAGSMSRSGTSRDLLILAEAGMFRMVVSRQVLDEVEGNLRNKLPGALPLMAELLGHIQPAIVGDPTPDSFARWLHVIEAKDAPILEAALQAEAGYLVTLNSRHFTEEVSAASGLRIVSPGAFIEELRRIVTAGLA